jgi:hypothetical protein
MTVELGLITPPVGMNVFFINSITADVGIVSIFKGVLPFVLTHPAAPDPHSLTQHRAFAAPNVGLTRPPKANG